MSRRDVVVALALPPHLDEALTPPRRGSLEWMELRRARVVIVGGSAAGLLAAAAVAGHVRSVVVFDRDRFPAGPTPRAGVPQGTHQHVLLHRGLLAAERLLPGLRADLVGAGAVPVDTGH